MPGEDQLSDSAREYLAMLRSFPQVPEEEDPNDWLLQILGALRRSPGERLKRWTGFSNESVGWAFRRRGYPHVEFSPARVLGDLTAHGVCFVMVGMGAGYLQGAPYPSCNSDITPSTDPENIARMEQVLGGLEARPLDRDEWGPVSEHTLPGFRRLMTSAGMVNVVDVLPGVGGYDRLMERADLMDLGDGLSVWVASLEDVIRSKETVGNLIVGEKPYSRMMDGVHVLMCKETLAAKVKYGF